MECKTNWLEKNDDTDALKKQLQSEGFDAYQWSGRPGGEYLDYIHTQDEVLCVLSGTAEVIVADAQDTIKRGDRIDVPANTLHSLTVTSAEPLVVLTGMRKS